MYLSVRLITLVTLCTLFYQPIFSSTQTTRKKREHKEAQALNEEQLRTMAIGLWNEIQSKKFAEDTGIKQESEDKFFEARKKRIQELQSGIKQIAPVLWKDQALPDSWIQKYVSAPGPTSTQAYVQEIVIYKTIWMHVIDFLQKYMQLTLHDEHAKKNNKQLEEVLIPFMTASIRRINESFNEVNQTKSSDNKDLAEALQLRATANKLLERNKKSS